jgi:hypothetical protein
VLTVPRNYIALVSQGIHSLGISALNHATWQMDRAINVSMLCSIDSRVGQATERSRKQ